MAGVHVFHAVQHSELDTLGLVDIRDFSKKRASYLWHFFQNNKSDEVDIKPINVVALIDSDLLENRNDIDKRIDADSDDDCTDKSVIKFLESTKDLDASVMAEFVKAKVKAMVSFAMSEKYPMLRVFCRPDQCSLTNSHVDNNSCLISE
jgi:hypothetical protein